MIRLLTGDHGSGKTSALADAVAATWAADNCVREKEAVL